MTITPREAKLLVRCAKLVLAGEWPWEPEKSGEREALERAAERLLDPAAPGVIAELRAQLAAAEQRIAELRGTRARTIEECAKVCDEHAEKRIGQHEQHAQLQCIALAAAIRALASDRCRADPAREEKP